MIWLVEVDVGGYDYQLLEVFSNENAARDFAAWNERERHFGVQVRPVSPLDSAPEPPVDYRDYRPLAWGDR